MMASQGFGICLHSLMSVNKQWNTLRELDKRIGVLTETGTNVKANDEGLTLKTSFGQLRKREMPRTREPYWWRTREITNRCSVSSDDCNCSRQGSGRCRSQVSSHTPSGSRDSSYIHRYLKTNHWEQPLLLEHEQGKLKQRRTVGNLSVKVKRE